MNRRQRPVSRPRSRSHQYDGDTRGWWLAGFAVLLVAGIFYYIFTNRPPEVDLATNCPKEAGYVRNSISVLLDTTDSLSATQQKLIQNTIYGVVNGAAPYDRIKIYEIRPAYDKLLNPVFDFCKPSKNELGSPVLLRFEEQKFKQQLQSYMENINYDLPTSPVIRAIGSVAADFPQDDSVKLLIVASDFIEFSEILNQYKSDWTEQYSKNRKQVDDARPDLYRVRLAMLFIPRPTVAHHDQEFAAWWRKYLTESGAQLKKQTLLDTDSGTTFVLHPFIPITG